MYLRHDSRVNDVVTISIRQETWVTHSHNFTTHNSQDIEDNHSSSLVQVQDFQDQIRLTSLFILFAKTVNWKGRGVGLKSVGG